MRIEVIQYHDDESDTQVFVDGCPVDAEIVAVDPGRGGTLAEWHENCEFAAQDASPAAACLIREWFRRGEASPYLLRS